MRTFSRYAILLHMSLINSVLKTFPLIELKKKLIFFGIFWNTYGAADIGSILLLTTIISSSYIWHLYFTYTTFINNIWSVLCCKTANFEKYIQLYSQDLNSAAEPYFYLDKRQFSASSFSSLKKRKQHSFTSIH